MVKTRGPDLATGGSDRKSVGFLPGEGGPKSTWRFASRRGRPPRDSKNHFPCGGTVERQIVFSSVRGGAEKKGPGGK